MQFTPPPLVSVIIPFLNGANWLGEAIESVISQSYLNWELILVDDGSETEATSIARRYFNKHPDKIKYADHPGHVNKGVTISRNLGITLSKGSFIAFLDADDRWMPDKLFHQLEIFGMHPEAAMICEASLFWYSWNNANEKDRVISIGVPPDQLYCPPVLMEKLYPLGAGAPPCPTGIIIRKDAFMRSGGFEESFTGVYQLYEDQAFLAKIYLNENVYISGTANNYYRKRPGSLTASADDETHYKKVRLFFLDWLEKYLQQHPFLGDKIFELLKGAKKIMNEQIA